jgi:hypothetical protein
MRTLRRFELGWLAFCVSGWLLLSLAGGESQAECDAKGEWICLSTRDMFILVGIYGSILWALGALLIGAIYGFHRLLWRRRPATRAGASRDSP